RLLGVLFVSAFARPPWYRAVARSVLGEGRNLFWGRGLMLESRWLILAVLFIARFALGYQFQSVGSVAAFIKPDLHIDYAQVALLIGAFLFPGVAISVPSGYLSRRFGDKNIVVAGMVLMIIGGLLTAGPNYGVLLAGRLLSGTGGAILVVVMLKMIIDWFAEREVFFGMAGLLFVWPTVVLGGAARA